MSTLDAAEMEECTTDLSEEVIARFIDVMNNEYGLSREARRRHRNELSALDEWICRARGRSLAEARRNDLMTYMRARLSNGMRTREFERLLMCMQHFYRHLKEGGFRDDNPAARLCSILASEDIDSSPAYTVLRRAS